MLEVFQYEKGFCIISSIIIYLGYWKYSLSSDFEMDNLAGKQVSLLWVWFCAQQFIEFIEYIEYALELVVVSVCGLVFHSLFFVSAFNIKKAIGSLMTRRQSCLDSFCDPFIHSRFIWSHRLLSLAIVPSFTVESRRKFLLMDLSIHLLPSHLYECTFWLFYWEKRLFNYLFFATETFFPNHPQLYIPPPIPPPSPIILDLTHTDFFYSQLPTLLIGI